MTKRTIIFSVLFLLLVTIVFAANAQNNLAVGGERQFKAKPVFSEAVAFDTTAPLSELASTTPVQKARSTVEDVIEVRPDRGPVLTDNGYSPDGALQFSGLEKLQQATKSSTTAEAVATMGANFEGISNNDNFNLFGFRVNPPDPVGDVGPNHYVEMVNLAFAVYDKQGNPLVGPLAIGDLWAGFEIEDCTDPSGDPIVIYDQLVNRWILTQFTTRGFEDPTLPFYDCVAVSKTPDPTGPYYRYAFITQPDTDTGFGYYFPDYPKYGVWTDSYIMTTRDFGVFNKYGISVYALEKAKMISGNPKARAVQFFIDSDEVPLQLIGDGLLPADIDGQRRPQARVAAPIVGTMDDDANYGATFDALNIWELSVQWNSRPDASLEFVGSFPVEAFDSVFPCAPTSRDCLPQPGIANPAQFLDVQSYRQRPIHRLAYRNFGDYEAMVTNQSVEALSGEAGVRWYELRRTNGQYEVYQQGTYAPDDGVHRWMGSIAMDDKGNMALGYSVVNGVDVYPGIRFTGRMAGDPLGQMTLTEGTIIDGSGVQTTTNSRWGDYTSMNVDPRDDCTFWYVNEYYTAEGQASSAAGWQTRIASFSMPDCKAK
jgi:hypothetical protein